MLNVLSSIIIGLCPSILVTVLGFVFYQNLESKGIVLIVFGFLFSLAIIVGYKIYRRVRKVGVLKFMTYHFASPELDNNENE